MSCFYLSLSLTLNSNVICVPKTDSFTGCSNQQTFLSRIPRQSKAFIWKTFEVSYRGCVIPFSFIQCNLSTTFQRGYSFPVLLHCPGSTNFSLMFEAFNNFEFADIFRKSRVVYSRLCLSWVFRYSDHPNVHFILFLLCLLWLLALFHFVVSSQQEVLLVKSGILWVTLLIRKPLNAVRSWL